MRQERETHDSQRPEFVETIDRPNNLGRVGILADGTWLVGWSLSDGSLVWHKHTDVFRVFRQNERVIQKFLGVPVDLTNGDATTSDPSLGVSLPQLEQTLMIFGEVQKAQHLANLVSRVVALSVNKRTPATELFAQFELLSRELGERVRNPLKVAARSKLAQAGTAETIVDAQIASTEAFDALLWRTREGMSIVKALFDRAGKIVEWVDTQEQQIGILRIAIGASLVEIQNARQRGQQVLPQTIENWQNHIFGSNGELGKTLAIRGNPYAEIMKKPEIKRFAGLNGNMSPLNISTVQRRFEEAYRVVDQVLVDRKDREASGLYARYRRKKT